MLDILQQSFPQNTASSRMVRNLYWKNCKLSIQKRIGRTTEEDGQCLIGNQTESDGDKIERIELESKGWGLIMVNESVYEGRM